MIDDMRTRPTDNKAINDFAGTSQLYEANEDDPRLLQLKGRKRNYDGKTATGLIHQTRQDKWLEQKNRVPLSQQRN